MTGCLDYRFEELPLIDEGGFEAGLVDGEAEIGFYADGQWFIRSISVECTDYKTRQTRLVEIDAKTEMYLNIFDQLERGKYRDRIESDVQTALESAAENAAADRADHHIRLVRETA